MRTAAAPGECQDLTIASQLLCRMELRGEARYGRIWAAFTSSDVPPAAATVARARGVSLSSRDDVRSSAARDEPEVLVESVYPTIGAAALQEHVVAVGGPRLRQRRPDHRAAVTEPAEAGMRDYTFQEPVAPALTEQIRRGDQHARRREPDALVGHEDVDPLPLERLPPDTFCAFERLDGGAHLRGGEQLEERRQVGGTGKARKDHPQKVAPFEADVQLELQSRQARPIGMVAPLRAARAERGSRPLRAFGWPGSWVERT